MAKTRKSNKPTGLTISRNGGKFVCEWKFGEKNYSNGQEFHYSIGKGWQKVSATTSEKKKVVNITLANYYPHVVNGKVGAKITSFNFKVRGNADIRKKGKDIALWSDPASLQMKLTPPAAPTLSVARDDNAQYKATFTWATSYDNTNTRPFANVEYQTMFIQNSSTNDGSKLNWSSASKSTKSASGSVTYTEDLNLTNGKSYTRWVRVRSRGCAGDSKWVYAHYTYAEPNKAKITDATVTKETAGYHVTVNWKQSLTASRPIDTMTIKYIKDTPAEGLVGPSDDSWTDARTVSGYNGNRAVTFPVNGLLGDDQCLFAAVVSNHDKDESWSDPYLVECGNLTDPESLVIDSHDDTNHRVSVSVTNSSDVEDAFIAILYMPSSDPDGKVVAVSSAGEGSKTINNIQCPDWDDEDTVTFGAYAVVGTATLNTDGFYDIKAYSGKKLMRSAATLTAAFIGESIPKAPAVVTVENGGNDTAVISWEHTWDEADSAELSWSDDQYAWQSTEEPSTYIVSDSFATSWRIAGVDAGKTWYFRVRLIKTQDDDSYYGPYSDTMSLRVSTAPPTPILNISDSVTTDEFTCYWDYVSGDGTGQSSANIYEAELVNNEWTYTPIATVNSESHTTLSAEELGWSVGTTHLLCIQLVSVSGQPSTNMSDTVSVSIAEPPSVTITNPFTAESDTDRSWYALKELPLTVSVTGAGDGTSLTAYIKRAEYYPMMRPDETEYDGFKDEIVVSKTGSEVSSIDIDVDDLIGSLDDGAKYILHVDLTDTYGQTAWDEIEFEVHWTHQAIVPTATVEMYKGISKITVTQPQGYASGDTFDIYRLSADKPQLIYKGGEFGTAYADPFPAIGEMGGHRIVYRTKNGDYTTEDGTIAWLDLGADEGDILESERSIIDFGLEQIYLYYNQDFSTTWQKDFKQTSYLGGSVQGDWNPAIIRSTAINAVTIPLIEEDTVEAMRRLAEWAGICHVRTIEGSSYPADVQVTESREHDSRGYIVTYELQTTRVDAEELDGMTFEDWADRYDRIVVPLSSYVVLPDNTRLAVDFGEE